jgi:hypothetical protein
MLKVELLKFCLEDYSMMFNKLNKCEVEIGGSGLNSVGSLFDHIQQKFKINNL